MAWKNTPAKLSPGQLNKLFHCISFHLCPFFSPFLNVNAQQPLPSLTVLTSEVLIWIFIFRKPFFCCSYPYATWPWKLKMSCNQRSYCTSYCSHTAVILHNTCSTFGQLHNLDILCFTLMLTWPLYVSSCQVNLWRTRFSWIPWSIKTLMISHLEFKCITAPWEKDKWK